MSGNRVEDSQSAEFVRVFEGVDDIEPFLLRDWLIRNHLNAEVRGVHLMGGIGELLPGTFPTVWVPRDQSPQASVLVTDFLRPKTPKSEWACLGCGEKNPGEFDSCWSCRQDSPNLAQTKPRSGA